MSRRNVVPDRGRAEAPPIRYAFPDRWYGKLALLLLSVGLLTLSFTPFKQFYLAWVALVPWLIVLRHCRSAITAFCWSWIAGAAFFSANMWWLAWVTGPGLIALMAVLGLYWAVAGMIIRGAGLLPPPGASVRSRSSIAVVFLITAVWVALEWVRDTWPLGGLAWQYLGHSQSPVLPLCQIADITGVYGISFWVAMVNVWVALAVIGRMEWRPLLPSAACLLLIIGAAAGYGVFRMSQHTATAGPRVLVVQPNYPQSNSGSKGASLDQILADHLRWTEQALARDPNVDLVVWSETMMPPLNLAARRLAGTWEAASQQIIALARNHHVAVLAGGMYYDQWTQGADGNPLPLDRRNSAYFYLPTGQSELHYDKIHLVPFGEYLPFKSTIPPLYRLFLWLSPYSEEYTLTAGASDATTVFELKPGWRFVTPICFEDMDAVLVRRMFAPPGGTGKRADFIVNITNDGWFRFNEMPQHLQQAIFRGIENRIPTARSVNTGISGFIDSYGRTSGLLPPGTQAVSVATLALDSRLTFYTRFGDIFAYICAAVTAGLVAISLARRQMRHDKPQGAKS